MATWAQARILANSLLDIRKQTWPTKADALILEGQFDFPGTTMLDLGRATVAAAQRLCGRSAARAVGAAFHDRGILSLQIAFLLTAEGAKNAKIKMLSTRLCEHCSL